MTKDQFFDVLDSVTRMEFEQAESILASVGGHRDPDRIPVERYADVIAALREAGGIKERTRMTADQKRARIAAYRAARRELTNAQRRERRKRNRPAKIADPETLERRRERARIKAREFYAKHGDRLAAKRRAAREMKTAWR
jgi:hypothetical protein